MESDHTGCNQCVQVKITLKNVLIINAIVKNVYFLSIFYHIRYYCHGVRDIIVKPTHIKAREINSFSSSSQT